MIKKLGVTTRCAAGGVCLAGSVPPWGWWPLAFIGIAILDRLIADQPWAVRFRRTWMTAAWWLFPAMLWMFALTPGGYIAAGLLYSTYFAIAAALVPSSTYRRVALPGAFALAELARWSWPFGGVPLAHLGLSQVNTPITYAARLAGPLLVVVCVVVAGQALATITTALTSKSDRQSDEQPDVQANRQPQLRWVAGAVVFVIAATVGGFMHPRSTVVREVDVALVQGGGPAQTRASAEQQPVVLGRHVEATRQIDKPVDLIIWPENVVNPGRYLSKQVAFETVSEVAETYDAPVLAGWFLKATDDYNVNYQSTITPEGEETDRYDKVRLVPFGEYVPLRSTVEALAGSAVPLPGRDTRPGTVEPVLDTDVGPVGVSISWEGFFEHRARHSIREGAQLLTNPTNGSSFWLTQVQTQQVASNQLRAMENDRWVLQVAPTGLSAVVTPDGDVVQRTDTGERRTLTDTVEMREGRTLASFVGPWPVVLYALAAIVFGLYLSATRSSVDLQRKSDGTIVD